MNKKKKKLMHLIPRKLSDNETKHEIVKFPVSVDILGKTFEVKYMKLEGLAGECIGSDFLIKINKKLSVEQTKSALLHEMIHAAMYVSGQSSVLEFLTKVNKDDEVSLIEEALVLMFENTFIKYFNLPGQ